MKNHCQNKEKLISKTADLPRMPANKQPPETSAELAADDRLQREIKERKQVEEALRLSEERFYKAFHANPILMSIKKFADWRYIDVNESWLEHMGFRREEVIGRTPVELNLISREEHQKIHNILILAHGLTRNEKIQYRAKSGDLRTGLISTDLIEIDGERCILSAIKDITEHEKVTREMVRLERLFLVGEMAAGIAHEIRNPVTTVRGFLQMLSQKEECARYKDYFKLMIEELDRTIDIVEEFLNLTKNKTMELKPHYLNDIIKALFPLLQADALASGKYIKLELSPVSNLLLDEKEIRQLVLNLVRNGLEAMSPGGVLTIKTWTEGETTVLAVRDQGKGIEPGIQDKIQDPFFTTKDNGTGLGLTVCYGIAARHNATIEFTTGKEGTTFFVRFNNSF